MNLWVILCGVNVPGEGPYGPAPDVYGPFNSKDEAQAYLDKHIRQVEEQGLTWVECFGGVTPGGHDIVQVFK